MERLAFRAILPGVLAASAAWSLAWGASHALTDSADLLRRAEEVALFLDGDDPYADPDLTYPPSALPVFASLIGPFEGAGLRAAWLVLNLAALAALGLGIVRVWTSGWTNPDRLLLLLAIASSKPARAGIALGQFHLIPTALAVWSIPTLRSGRPVAAGLLLGLAAIKPTMVLPLLGLWAIQREWRALATTAAVQAGLTTCTSIRLGLGPLTLVREWLANARTQETAGTLDLPTLAAAIAPRGVLSGSLLSLVTLAACLAVLHALRRADDRTLGALALALSAVFAYHRHYDLVLLLPALAWLADRAGRSGASSMLGGIGADHPSEKRFGLKGLVAAFGAALIVPSQPVPITWFEAAHAVATATIAYASILAIVTIAARDACLATAPATPSEPLGSRSLS